jgi:hypothetical protein
MKKMKLISFILIFILMQIKLFANEDPWKNIFPDKSTEYIIVLDNGDILTGYIDEYINSPELGEGIKFKTSIGIAEIFNSQIKTIKTNEENYRHGHRVFLLPTADPIGSNHFIGSFELLFLYMGAGIGDIFSITAGRSIVPGIASSQQLSVLNLKATLFEETFDTIKRKLSLAVGGNLGFVNSNNRMIHYYGTGTFKLSKTSITAAIFYKAGSQDYNKLVFYDNVVDMYYENGSFGIGMGIDTRFGDTHGLHFIGELWNSNVAKPTHTGVLLGLRLCNSNFSADFGLAFFTQPFVAPFTSFVWTPFNY